MLQDPGILLPCTACLIALATQGTFARTQLLRISDCPLGTRIVMATTLLGILATVAVLTAYPASGWPLAGFLLYGASFGLYLWAYDAMRGCRLSMPFSEDMPGTLVTAGPYALIRHPFYASYILFWLAGAVTTGDWRLLFLTAFMTGLYWRAAAIEEGQFVRSIFANDYTCYRARTRMFLPWFF